MVIYLNLDISTYGLREMLPYFLKCIVGSSGSKSLLRVHKFDTRGTSH